MFFLVTAVPGQNIYACVSADVWSAQAGSSGATMSSQLQDLAATTTVSAMLTIGQNCSTVTPCNVRIGSVTYSISAPASLSISGGTGLAYIFVASNGALTVGSSLAVTCNSVCVVQNGVSGFPPGSVPLFTASATNGVWNANGISDYRAFLSVKNVVGSSGVVSVDSGGAAMLSLDSSVVSLKVSVPGTSSSACTANQWSTDGAYYYLCVSNNLWKRTALSSW